MFITFFIIFICVFYLIRLAFRLVLPMFLQGMVNKASQRGAHQYQEPRRNDDAVKVHYAPKTKSQIPDSEGDFIDYEEIK